MATAINFGRGRLAFLKCSMLIVLIVALFAIINYTVRNSAADNGYIEEAAKRAAYGGWKPANGGLKTKSPKKWEDEYTHNPCYTNDSQLFCGPAVYLMGIQYAGLNILKKAIGLHPDVDCYATGFFSNFTDMRDIGEPDMVDYINNFGDSADQIQNGSDSLCICDSGRDLARPYDLRLRYGGVQFPPKFTTAAALATLNYYMKVIVILRDPTIRFIREYCALNIAYPFEDVVDEAIMDYETCENDIDRNNASCVYDDDLSRLLQAGLYDFLIEEDLSRSFGDFKLIAWNHLENPATRNSTMASIFNFLGKDIPYPDDPYWSALDDCFIFSNGDCNGQIIPAAAKQRLRDFYKTRATIFDQIL